MPCIRDKLIQKYTRYIFLYIILDQNKNKKNEIIQNIDKLKKEMIEKSKAIFGNFGLRFINQNNRFFVAEENIRVNQTIAKIPFKTLYSIKNSKVANFCKQLNITEFSTNKKLYENQYSCLHIFILKQIKYTDDDLKTYVESIPKAFDEYPLFYKGRDREIIKKSFIENSVLQNEKTARTILEIVNRSTLKNQFTLKEIKHALIALNSRNFGVNIINEKKHYHVFGPYIDLFNFNPNSHTTWTDKIKDENDFFTIEATNNIKKGDEVYVYYGSYDNNHYLTSYGFTFPNNTFEKKNEYFKLNFKGKEEWLQLNENKFENIIQFVTSKRNTKPINKDQKIIADVKLFQEINKKLKSYSNKERLNYLKKNLKETENFVNIYRVLLDEDILINKNIKFIEDIIDTLKKGKSSFQKKSKPNTVIEANKDYFEYLFK